MFCRKITTLFLMVTGLCCLDCQNSFAQLKLNKGEKVKVKYLGEWRDGTVLETRGKQSNIEYTFVKVTSKVFNRNLIRKLCEFEGIDYARRWESADGQFKIVAALKSGDATKVVLIKEDLEKITVPLASLSSRDNAYAKKMLKSQSDAVASGNAPAATPDLPPISNFGSAADGSALFKSSSAKNLQPFGATPSFMQFSQQGVAFDFSRKMQELVAVIPVGGPEELVLVTARENNFFNEGIKYQSQVYWLSMKQQKVVATVPVTTEHFPIDYDPRTKTLLTFFKKGTFKDDEVNAYTLWSLKPGASDAKPIVRWKTDLGTFQRQMFGKVINDEVVLVKTDKNTYVGYDIKQKKIRYVYKSQSFFDVPAILTPDRKSLIICEDTFVSIVDAATGDSINRLSIGSDRGLSGANVNASGTKLAAITSRNVFVWDLNQNNKTPRTYRAPHVASPFRSRVEWIDDDLILCDGLNTRILYRLSLELPVWSYGMDVGSPMDNENPLKNCVVNGKCFYYAKPDFRQKTLTAIGVVQMPGPQVEEITKNVDRNSLDLLHPGSRIRLNIESVTEFQKVDGWLREKIEANEWVVDDSSDIVMTATMGVGAQQTIQYETIGTGQVFSVTFQPHYSTLRITKGKMVIWQGGTSTGAPSFIRADNAQAEVRKYQQPNLGFFSSVQFPARVIDPKYSRGFGVSKLGLKGIEVESTSPPGREDDPDEAVRQAEEQRQKDADKQRNQNQ